MQHCPHFSWAHSIVPYTPRIFSTLFSVLAPPHAIPSATRCTRKCDALTCDALASTRCRHPLAPQHSFAVGGLGSFACPAPTHTQPCRIRLQPVARLAASALRQVRRRRMHPSVRRCFPRALHLARQLVRGESAPCCAARPRARWGPGAPPCLRWSRSWRCTTLRLQQPPLRYH